MASHLAFASFVFFFKLRTPEPTRALRAIISRLKGKQTQWVLLPLSGGGGIAEVRSSRTRVRPTAFAFGCLIGSSPGSFVSSSLSLHDRSTRLSMKQHPSTVHDFAPYRFAKPELELVLMRRSNWGNDAADVSNKSCHVGWCNWRKLRSMCRTAIAAASVQFSLGSSHLHLSHAATISHWQT